jgi:hypothetical protein
MPFMLRAVCSRAATLPAPAYDYGPGLGTGIGAALASLTDLAGAPTCYPAALGGRSRLSYTRSRLTEVVPVRFPADLLEEIRRRADADDRSLSAWIRRAVERELRRPA